MSLTRAPPSDIRLASSDGERQEERVELSLPNIFEWPASRY